MIARLEVLFAEHDRPPVVPRTANKMSSIVPPSIHMLPDELLSHIMCLALPYFESDDHISWSTTASNVHTYLGSLLFVCKLWNALALSTPRLWTLAYWGGHDGSHTEEETATWFITFLSRSRGLPTHVMIDHPESYAYISRMWYGIEAKNSPNPRRAVKDALLLHSGRIQSLFWSYPEVELWPHGATWSILRSLCAVRFLELDSVQDRMDSLAYLQIKECPVFIQSCIPSPVYTSSLKKFQLQASHYGAFQELLLQCGLEEMILFDCDFYDVSTSPSCAPRIQFEGSHFREACDIFAANTIHLSAVVRDALIDFPIFGNLVTLDVSFLFIVQDELPVSPLVLISDAPALRAFSYRGSVTWQHMRDLFAKLGGEVDGEAASSARVAPSLAFLRLLDIYTTDEDDGLEGATATGPEQLRVLLERRPHLKVEFASVNLPDFMSRRVYLPVAKEMPERLVVRKTSALDFKRATGPAVWALADAGW